MTTHAPTWRNHLFNLRMAASSVRYLPRLPVEMLEAVFPGIEERTLTLQHSLRGRSLPHGEAYVLSLITAHVRPERIFEIGTASGQSTLLMARQAPGASIDTLDLGSEAPSLGVQPGEPPIADLDAIGSAYRATEHAARISQHFGDSAQFDYGPFAGKIDLVFVDGSHTYEYVRADSSSALSMLAPGGVVVWDDCNYVCPGVAHALLGLRGEGFPVVRIFGTRFAVLNTRVGSTTPAESESAADLVGEAADKGQDAGKERTRDHQLKEGR
jgi:predicted O-methyltransferase YrrM